MSEHHGADQGQIVPRKGGWLFNEQAVSKHCLGQEKLTEIYYIFDTNQLRIVSTKIFQSPPFLASF